MRLLILPLEADAPEDLEVGGEALNASRRKSDNCCSEFDRSSRMCFSSIGFATIRTLISKFSRNYRKSGVVDVETHPRIQSRLMHLPIFGWRCAISYYSQSRTFEMSVD
jgi:hypothetical protein